MSDSKTLEAVQDKLSGNQRDKIDFIQAEQNILYGDLHSYAYFGRDQNLNGYSAQGFKIYEHPNSPLVLSEIRAAKGLDKITFIRKGRLLDGEMTPVIKMQRVYRDPLDKSQILRTEAVPLDNFFNIKKKINENTSKQVERAQELRTASPERREELLRALDGSGANYEKLKYGLTGLDFTLKNQNPFAASRMVDVTIQFTLESLLAFDYAHANGFSLKNLITFSKGRTTNQEAYEGYSLRLAIGYDTSNHEYNDLNHDPETTKYLKEVSSEINNILLELELVDYDISVQENDSSVLLTLNYVSFIEDFSKKAAFDIFAGKIMSSQQISEDLGGRNIATSLKQDLEVIQSNLPAIQAALSAARGYNQITQTLEKQGITTPMADSRVDPSKRKQLEDFKKRVYKGNAAYSTALVALANDTGAGVRQDLFEDNSNAPNIEAIQEALTDIESKYSTAKADYDKKIQEINDRLIFQNKIAKYNIILENIFRSNKVYETELKTKDLVLFSNEATEEIKALIQQEAELAAQSVTVLTPEAATEDSLAKSQAEVQGAKAKAAKNASKNIKKTENIIQQVTANDAAKAVAQLKKAIGDGFTEEDELRSFVNARLAGGGPISKVGDTYKFYYVYLGDIIDAALANESNGTMYAKMNEAKLGLILGSITAPDPQSSDPNKKVNINLADFPISLQYFLRFFKKNIVEKDINKYDVTKFLQDLATQLISPAINSRTNNFGKSHKDPVQVKITTLPLVGESDPTLSFGVDPAYLGRPSDNRYGTRFNLSNPENMRFLQKYSEIETVDVLSDSAKTITPYNYFYMYGTNEVGFSVGSSNVSKGVSITNLRAQRGIYSFLLGGAYDAIDLSYSFQKVKKNYQTEMMAARAMEKGEEYREAWNQYDLTIEMVGNAIFYPGMHIYSTVNLPEITGYTDSEELVSSLGLEGYYLVTNVENKIEKQFWTTTITAKWQSSTGGIGKGDSKPLATRDLNNQNDTPSIEGTGG